MPYIIRPPKLLNPPQLLGGALAAFAAVLLFGAGSAHAEQLSTSACQAPELSRPFLNSNDSNYYMLAPGQQNGGFEGQGWTLSGGATVKKAVLPNNKTGSVLDLPSGSVAVSPVICVSTEFPVARTMVRDVVGSEGVFFNVSYAGTSTWENPKNTGQVHGHGSEWSASDRVNMQPENVFGWQLVKITLVAGGNPSNPSDFQVDGLYIDPYRR